MVTDGIVKILIIILNALYFVGFKDFNYYFYKNYCLMPNDSELNLIRISGMDYSNRIRLLLKDKKDSYDLTDLLTEQEDPNQLLGRIGIGLDKYLVCSKEDGGIAYFMNEDQQKKIVESFKKADVLFFSGHHFGSDYNPDQEKRYEAPGLTSALTFKLMVPGSGYFFSPAFDLGTLLREDSKGKGEKKNVFDNVKVVISVSCNFIRENVLPLFKNLFPNAVILGYHGNAPLGTNDDNLLENFFNKVSWDTVSAIKKLSSDASDEDKKQLRSKMKQYFCKLWVESLEGSNYLSEPGYFFVEDGTEKGVYFTSKDKEAKLDASPKEFKSRVTMYKGFDLKGEMEKLAKTNKE